MAKDKNNIFKGFGQGGEVIKGINDLPKVNMFNNKNGKSR